MGRLLFLIFLIGPLLEIGLFIVIGQKFGLVPTLLGVLISGMIGAGLIRNQGLSLIAEMRDSVNGGRLPARSLADAMMVGLAGLLLLLPGYFSDLLGILLLLPPVRGLIYGFLARRVKVVDLTATTSTPRPTGPRVIELDDDSWRPG